MRASEKSLLIAARDRIRAAGYQVEQCNVEFDEMAAATVGDVYLAICPGGWRPGPRHNTSGGVNDLLFAVRVIVVKRLGNVPRDRRRDIFLNNLDSLDQDIDRAYGAIDWKYDLINAASALIVAETGSTEGFIEPLRLIGDVSPPKLAPAELFGGKEADAAAMVRTMFFGGARRITTKT